MSPLNKYFDKSFYNLNRKYFHNKKHFLYINILKI